MEGEAQKYLEIVRKNVGVLAMGSLGILFLLLGFFFYIQEKSKPPEMTITTSEASVSGTLKVDVEGAVMKAGVYELPGGARVQDGLVAAGGLSALADREYVSKNINLAAKVIDGAKIYIPRKNETVNSIQGTANSIQQVININTASESELDKLYGVGVATAQKIISGRPYSKIEDLVSKKVLGQAAFEKIKDKITVY